MPPTNFKSPTNHAHPQCSHCGSFETVMTFEEANCLRCGGLTKLTTGEAVSHDEQYSPSGL